MTEKVHILQRDYLQMHDLAIHEIQKLKSHLEEIKQYSEYPAHRTYIRADTAIYMSHRKKLKELL